MAVYTKITKQDIIEVAKRIYANNYVEVQKMKGEIDFIKGEHHTAKEKFIETN